MSLSPINATTGSQGCSCINVTNELLSLSDLTCTLPTGQTGFRFTVGSPCLDVSYGSNYCLQHDLLWDTKTCNVDEAGVNVVPAYCFRPWCYVDAASCGRDSEERAFQSSYITYESGINVYYSYSTCNSTAEDWFDYTADDIREDKLGGVNVRATIPYYQIPSLYKTVDGIKTLNQGDEYYNDSIPYEGIYLNYIQNIADTTNGDIQNMTYTHRTRASSIVHPYSKATAAVQDVADGLSDMVLGPIWITGQRLALTSFTIPFVVDKSYLVVPREGSESLTYEIQKVLEPFSPLLWFCILLVICFAAALSVWFFIRANPHPRADSNSNATRGRMRDHKKAEICRLCLDSFLEKFTFFTSAGVEQDVRASLPTKILMFGFGFFILIAVSAYVANLAAFLTQSGDQSVTSMEQAVVLKISICAHPAIEDELRDAWPDGNFYFHQEGNEFRGILQDYDDGKCSAMVVGWEDTSADIALLNMYCDRNLAFTENVIAEIPMAWPIRTELASGMSYWIYNAQKYHDISPATVSQEYLEINGMATECDLKLSAADKESDDTTPIQVKNMFLPLILFVSCALLAAVLQVIHERRRSSRTENGSTKFSVLGRASTLNLFSQGKDPRRSILRQQKYDEEEFFDAHDIHTGVRESNGISSNDASNDKDGSSTEESKQSETQSVSFRKEESFVENRRLSLERS